MFRDEILKDFTNRFRGMQVSLLWTILLDPRLINMNGFSKNEISNAKKWPLEEMKKVPEKLREPTAQEEVDNADDCEN